MRKLLVIMCVIILASSVNAQQKDIENDVQKVINGMGVLQRIEAMREYERMWTKPEEEKEYMAKFEETVPVFLKNVEQYYLAAYNHDEIKELLRFYDTPLGKKIASNMANLNSAYAVAEEMWEEMFSEILFKYRRSKKKVTTN